MSKLKPITLSEFISEVHEIVREDGFFPDGKSKATYYRDMLRRIERAVDDVNARLISTGKRFPQ